MDEIERKVIQRRAEAKYPEKRVEVDKDGVVHVHHRVYRNFNPDADPWSFGVGPSGV